MKVNYMSKEVVIADNKEDEKKIGGIRKSKLLKVYMQLRNEHKESINFRVLNFENFVDFVLANGYEEEDVKTSNLLYDLKDDPCFGLE